MAINTPTIGFTQINNEVRLPINEPGFVFKLAQLELEIDLTTNNTYATGGFSIATALTTLGVAAADDVVKVWAEPLMKYASSAYVVTTMFRTLYDYVNQKISLHRTAINAAGAGSGAEAGDGEVANTTAINGATYLNGDTARMRLTVLYKKVP